MSSNERKHFGLCTFVWTDPLLFSVLNFLSSGPIKKSFYVYNSIMIICMLPIFRYDSSKVNENTIVLDPI